MATLKLAGKSGAGGTLTFEDSGRRRVITVGSEFEVGDELADILLETDPNVSRVDPESADAAASTAPKYADLVARAKELGIPATGKGPVIAAAIAAKEAELAAAAAAANEGGNEPADDPDAASSGEAGSPPSSGTSGAISLGDLTEGGKVNQ